MVAHLAVARDNNGLLQREKTAGNGFEDLVLLLVSKGVVGAEEIGPISLEA